MEKQIWIGLVRCRCSVIAVVTRLLRYTEHTGQSQIYDFIVVTPLAYWICPLYSAG